jgi:hypothetical protein
MTYLMGVILYTGAACVSPLESVGNVTTVEKVPCAEIVRYSSANPFKMVQEPNVVSLGEPKAVPKYTYTKTAKKKPRKKKRRR